MDWNPATVRLPSPHPVVRADVDDLVRMARELQPDMIINDRGTGEWRDYVSPENYVPDEPPNEPWESCFSLSEPYRRQRGGFWYKGPEAEYKSMDEILRLMAQIFSMGGNILLDSGPQPDGRIPDGEVALLRSIGEWMKVNGEAVYETSAGPAGRPDWGYVTKGKNTLYLWIFDPPSDGILTYSVTGPVKAARILGGEAVPFTKRGSDVTLSLPSGATKPVCSVVRLDLS
jgi:alpha-L-fucosidase